MGRGRPFRSKKHPKKAKYMPAPFYRMLKLE